MMRFARSSLTRYMAATLAAIFFSTGLAWAGESVKHWRHSPDHIGVDRTGLVLHLPLWMYDASTTKAWDISGQNNHGSIVGAVPHPHYGPELLSNTGFETGTADGANLITNPGFETIGAELVTNGSMEAGTADASELVTNGGFTSATTSWTGSDATLASVAGGQAGNCLEITRTGGTGQAAYQDIAGLTVGKVYKATFYVKSGSSGNEPFQVGWTTSGYGDYRTRDTTHTSSGSWVQYDVYQIADATTMSVYVQKTSATAGTMLFDTVSVKEAIPGPNLVTNGTMEAGTADGAELVSNGTLETNITDWLLMQATGTLAQEGTIAHGGTKSLKVTTDVAWDGTIIPLNVTIGHYYRAVFWLYGDASNRLMVDVWNNSSGIELLGHTIVPANWTKYEVVFKALATEVNAYFRVYSVDGANDWSFYLDDISVKECFPPTGWSGIGEPSAIDRSTIQKKNGTYSGHLVTVVANDGYQQSISLTANKVYLLSGWIYGDAINPISFRVRDYTNSVEWYATTTIVVPASFTYYEVLLTPTSSSSNAYIQVFGTNAVATTFYIDDVQVQELQTSSGYTPTGWSTSGLVPDLFERSSTSYAGSYSAHIVQASSDAKGMYQVVAKTAGKAYKLSFRYYLASGSGWYQINAGDGLSVLGSGSFSTTGAWTYLEKSVLETATGSGGVILFENNSTPAEFFIDDVSVVEVLSGWNDDSTVSNGSIELSTTTHGGTYSTKVTEGAAVSTSLVQKKLVTASSYYRLTFWTRGDGTHSGTYAIYDEINAAHMLPSGTYDSTGVTGATFTQKDTFFKTPANCTLIGIYLTGGTSNGYYAHYDDVSLQEVFAPTGWSAENTPTGFNRSTAITPHGGTYTLHLVGDATDDGARQSFTTVAGRNYRASFWVYLLSGGFATYAFTSGYSTLGNTTTATTGSWLYKEFDFTATTTDSLLDFLALGGAAEFYVDDVSVKEIYGHEVLGLGFDGVDDVVTVPHHATLATSTWSIMAWINYKENNLATEFLLLKNGEYGICAKSNTLQAYDNAYHDSTVAMPSGWSCICTVKTADGGTITIYKDGVSIFSEGATGDGPVGSDITIGQAGSGALPYKGNLGDLLIFNRALSAQEISDYYEATRWRYGR